VWAVLLTLAGLSGCDMPEASRALPAAHQRLEAPYPLHTAGQPLRGGTAPRFLASLDSTLFFVTSDDSHGEELWKTDGTPGGTLLVKDIRPGPGDGMGPRSKMVSLGDRVVFTAEDGRHGYEVWSSDGTHAGTVRLTDLHPGKGHGVPLEGALVAHGGNAYFVGTSSVHGPGTLWKTDGTLEGTRPLRSSGFAETPSLLTSVGATLYFRAGPQLWKTDGTDAGTVPVAEVGHLLQLANVHGTLMFLDGGSVWKSDGTGRGTVRVKQLESAPSPDARPAVVGETLYFLAHGNRELWKSDGTPDGTLLLKSFSTGVGFSYGAIHSLTAFQGGLFFTAASSTAPLRELWRTDGSVAGTVRVSSVSLSEDRSPPELVPFNGALYFQASDGLLWRTDGSETAQVRTPGLAGPLGPSTPRAAGNVLYFSAGTGANHELWALRAFPREPSDVSSSAADVALTSPTQGSFLRGSAVLEATVTSTLSVVRVEFYDGTNLLGSDSSAPYSLNWNTVGVSDGAHSLSVKAIELVGQARTSAQVGVTVDNTVPAAALSAPAQNAHVRGIIQLSATASDNVGLARVEFYDGATLLGTDYASPYELSWNTASVADGLHTLTAKAFDLAGNVSTSAQRGVTVDNTAPAAAALGAPAQGAQLRGTVQLSATASDNVGVARVEFYADATLLGTDTSAPYGLSWNTASVADGLHTLTAKAHDAAGNVTTSAGVEVLVDNTAPTTTLSAPAQNAHVRGSVQLSATASDNVGVAGVEFYDGPALLGAVYAPPYELSWNTTGAADGIHLLTARAFDSVGNVSVSVEVSVTVDNTAPAAALSAPAQNAHVRGSVQLSATTSDNVGVARVEFYAGESLLGTLHAPPYELSWNTAGVTNGAHTLTVKAHDAAGNAATSAEVGVTVDNSAPATALSSPAQNAQLRRLVQVSATASDNQGVTHVEFYANGALLGTDTTAPYDVSWNTAAGPNGSITLTTRAYDLAGNVTVSAGVTVQVDNAAPTVAITSPQNGASLFLSTTVEASAADNAGVTQVVFYDGATVIGTDTTAPYSVSWSLVWVSKGSHTLTAKAYDAVGNVTTSAPVTVTVN
jgi:ELWxxDGT repeat protein